MGLFVQVDVMTRGGPLDTTQSVVYQAVQRGYDKQDIAEGQRDFGGAFCHRAGDYDCQSLADAGTRLKRNPEDCRRGLATSSPELQWQTNAGESPRLAAYKQRVGRLKGIERQMTFETRQRLILSLRYTLMILISAIFIFPIVFMVMSSLKPDLQLLRDSGSLRAFLPVGDISLDNYHDAFWRVPMMQFFFNSVFTTTVSVLLALLLNSLAAFAFAFLQWRGKRLVLSLIIATFIVPFEVIAIPLLLGGSTTCPGLARRAWRSAGSTATMCRLSPSSPIRWAFSCSISTSAICRMSWWRRRG